MFIGANPPDGAVINYYQKTRHVFGRMKLEIFDSAGKLVDTLPASKRKGVNRVVWSMQTKPPRVPTAAQAAFAATSGPRVLPGDYTVRLTKGDQVIEQKLDVGLDRRATYTADDRKAQYDEAMHAQALFGRMTDLVDRLNGLKGLALARVAGLPAGDAVKAQGQKFADDIDVLRKEIVATKEGGAITGEERLREHLDQAYGAFFPTKGARATTRSSGSTCSIESCGRSRTARRRSSTATCRSSTKRCRARVSRLSRRRAPSRKGHGSPP